MVLQNNIFEFGEKISRQKCGQAKFFKKQNTRQIYGGVTLKKYFFWGGDWKDKLKMFIIIFINLYKTHNMIKFRAEWSNSTINFLDFVMSINNGVIETVLHVKPANSHQ